MTSFGAAKYRKRAVTADERRALAARYQCAPGGTVAAPCMYCGVFGRINWLLQPRGKGWVQFEALEIEHKTPEFHGGQGGENLDLACLPCNRAKGPRTLEQWRNSCA